MVLWITSKLNLNFNYIIYKMYQIIDPETNQPINLYSDRVNQLFNQYDEKTILSMKIITPLQFNRNTIFVDDILHTVMLHSSFDEIKSLCQTDKNARKLCQDVNFWEYILKRDDLYFEGVDRTLKSYEKLYHIRKKVNQLKIKNINFELVVGDIDLTKILTKQQLDIINKEWKDDHDDIFDYHVAEFTVYHPHYFPLGYMFSSTCQDGSVQEFQLNKDDIQMILLKTFYYYPNIRVQNF